MTQHQPPVRVERVLDDEVHVIVSIDPEQVVDWLAGRLVGHAGSLTIVRQLDPKGDNAHIRAAARARLVEAIGPALQVTLTAVQARSIGQEVDWAGRDGQPCSRYGCDWLADDTGECTQHQDAPRRAVS